MRHKTAWALLFILPCLLGLIVFTYGPSLCSFLLSFSYWNLLGNPHWVGLENYRMLWRDPIFWQTLGNTSVFVLGSVIFGLALALTIALALHRLARRYAKGVGFLRAAYFLPVITPMVSVALVWGWLFDPAGGIVNTALANFHVAPQGWLYDPRLALACLIALNIWKNLGYFMILLLAGLEAVPEELLEAASLDGANNRAQTWQVILPLLTPTLFFVVTVCLVEAFQAFDAIYLLTQGGPGNSTQVLTYWMFKNAFEFYRIGPASAIAYTLVLITFSVTLLQWWGRKKWVLHEN